MMPRTWRAATALILIAIQTALPVISAALPTDGQVAGGTAVIQQPSVQSLHVLQSSDRAIINWRGFNVAADEIVRFTQPNAGSIALNRVVGGDPSTILGQLQANGRVFLVNPNGIVFGSSAVVNTAGLLATTFNIKDGDFLAGKLQFAQDPGKALASIINKGRIEVSRNGFVVLAAPAVSNEGVIVANLGKVGLTSGQRLTVDFMGDGLITYAVDGKILEPVTGPDGVPLASAVSNAGTIQAEGGQVLLTARAASDVFSSVINQSGIVEARSLINRGGVIRLEGSDPVANTGSLGWQANLGKVRNAEGKVLQTGRLDVSSAEAGAAQGEVTITGQMVGVTGGVQANGQEGASGGRVLIASTDKTVVTGGSVIDTSGGEDSNGGTVLLWSDKETVFGGSIVARGGAGGGNGGDVEVSGHESLHFGGQVDSRAANGRTGTLLLDPANITVATAGGAAYNPGVNNLFTNTPASNVTITPASINAAGANIVLQANTDITVSDAVSMVNPGIGLTMQAGRSINVNAAVATNNGDIALTANDSEAVAANRAAGAGNITFGVGGSLSAGAGNITLAIGPSTSVPFNPGNISLHALTTTTGSISVTSRNALTLAGPVDAGAGTVTMAANADGAGAQGFTMNAGSSITTTNTSRAAVQIGVNAAGGGTGAAVLRNMTVGNGGTISVRTNTGGNTTGGDITQVAGTLLNVGSGTVDLATAPAVGSNIGTAAASIRTTAATVTANAGGSGVFVTETDGANVSATATGGGAVRLASTTGTLTISGPTSTASGAITLSSGDAVVVGSAVNAGSGTVTINANTNGAGAEGLTMTAGGSIITTNATTGAATINVNTAAGGTGGAALGPMTTGSGGRITVRTNTGGNTTGGSISQAASTTLTTGTGAIVLNTPTTGASGIGRAGAPVLTDAGTMTASAGSGGVFITESNGANFTATATGAGPIVLNTTSGTLTIAGVTSTGSGPITIGSGDAVVLNANVGGAASSGQVTINANTAGTDASGFTMAGTSSIRTTNTGAGAVQINVNNAAGGSGSAMLRPITSGGGGTISVRTDAGGNTTGGSIMGVSGTTLSTGSGSVLLGTPTAGTSGIGAAAASLRTSSGSVTANAGSGGVFITEANGASFTATATGAGPIDLTSATGLLSIAGPTSTGSGPITLTADRVAINAPLTSSGALILQPVTPARTIGIAGGTGGLSLSTASLSNLTDGFSTITIGRLLDGTGAVTVGGLATFADPVTIAGGSIVSNGTVSSPGNPVTLAARTGGMTDGNGLAANVVGETLAATVVTGMALDTAVNRVTATVTGTGSLSLNNAGALTVTSANTVNGTLTVKAAAGDLTVMTATAGGAASDVVLSTTTSGDVILGDVTAGRALVVNSAGSILDGNGMANNVTAAADSTLTALGVIGVAVDPLEVAVSSGSLGIAARSQSGNISAILNGTVTPANTLTVLNTPPGQVIFNGLVLYPPAPPPVGSASSSTTGLGQFVRNSYPWTPGESSGTQAVPIAVRTPAAVIHVVQELEPLSIAADSAGETDESGDVGFTPDVRQVSSSVINESGPVPSLSAPVPSVGDGKSENGVEQRIVDETLTANLDAKVVSARLAPSQPLIIVPALVLGDVFFEFESARVGTQGVDVLRRVAAWMKANPAKRIVVEGHCDERGPAAYNFVLGERRAKAIQDVLMALGVSRERVTTTSYGKERPFCSDHGEACWQLNRRGHMIPRGGAGGR
ncbi:two-partner secretion domain-containing protein [Candidatus Nitrospira bockiana]